jgi:hypothetical protein
VRQLLLTGVILIVPRNIHATDFPAVGLFMARRQPSSLSTSLNFTGSLVLSEHSQVRLVFIEFLSQNTFSRYRSNNLRRRTCVGGRPVDSAVFGQNIMVDVAVLHFLSCGSTKYFLVDSRSRSAVGRYTWLLQDEYV